MVNLRRELCVLLLCAVGAGLSACGRAPTEVSTLHMMLATDSLKLAPGQSGTVRVQVSATAELNSPVQLSSVGEGLSALPDGLAVAIEPGVVTLSGTATVTVDLRVAALPTAGTGTYSLIVTARSDDHVESARLKVTLSGAGQGWARQVGTAGTEVLTSLVVDSTGSLYAGGQTNGSFSGQTNAGDFDGYLLKYQPSGVLQWLRTLATAKSDVVTAMVVDPADNLYVAGYTYGAFPGNTAVGSADGFVAKYSASGAQIWLRQLGTSELDQFTAIAVDPTGGVVVLGATEGGFGLFSNQGPVGTSDVVVMKFAADGKPGFVQQLGTDQNERPTGVAVDATGAVYVVGSTQGTFAGAAAVGGYDTFLFKLRADGSLSWLRQVGTPYDDHLTAALIDSKGALVASGWTRGSFGGQIEAGGQDALLLRYGPDGTNQLTRQFGTSYNDVLNGLVRVGDALYSIGGTRGTFPNQSPAGAQDVFVARHNADGTIAWLSQMGTNQTDSGNGIAATATALYLGGTTFGAFDGQLLQGDSDGFVIQLLGAATAQGF
jgi:hypothetical protein